MTSSPLVVHAHLHRRATGVTRHVESVLPGLSRALEVRVLAPVEPDILGSAARIAWGELFSRARREPVVFHAHRVNELLVGLALRAWGRDVKLVWTRHAAGKPSRFTTVVAKRAERLVSISPESARTLGLPSELITHGVDTARFHPPVNRAAAWSALGLGGEYGVGVVGRVRADKGTGDFAEAIAPLLLQQADWRGVLVGTAKSADVAFKDALLAQAPGLVHVGEQAQVERWYAGFTVAVMPSHEESFGLARLEALASGCCLVTTRLNVLDQAIEQGRNGFTYEVGDVSSLREILAELMAQPARAAEIGARGVELARSQWGIDRQVDALLALYRSL